MTKGASKANSPGRLTWAVGARREGLDPPTARSVARRQSSFRAPLVHRCCSRPQNLVLSVRLVPWRPSALLSSSVKNSVNAASEASSIRSLIW
jgi:hypothetical protein